MIKKLILAGSIAAALFFFSGAENELESRDTLLNNEPNYTISENKAPDYYVRFMIVTPCINEKECLDFNEEILDGAVDYYAQYGITLEFVREYVKVSEDFSVDLGSHTNPAIGLALKLDLIRATGVKMPHIIHAPMFTHAEPGHPEYYILGVAQQYTQVVVLKQAMIDYEPTKIEEHVLIHEIGHIFGLPDIYNEESCNTMDGIVDHDTLKCQKLTPEQVAYMKQVIRETLM